VTRDERKKEKGKRKKEEGKRKKGKINAKGINYPSSLGLGWGRGLEITRRG
jgi:hypothetical protein